MPCPKNIEAQAAEVQPLLDTIRDKLVLLNQANNRKETALENLEKELVNQADIETAHEIAQQIALATQETFKLHLSELITSALESIFDDPYEFTIQFIQKRGGTEAHMKFIRDGLIIDPLTEAGGGVVDVAAFSLRLACILLSRPSVSRTVFLDEPFKFLSRDLQPKAGLLLQELSKKLGFKFVIVSHETDLNLDVNLDLGD